MSDFRHGYPAECSFYNTTDEQKAWHIFTILLDIGRPASLLELTGRCELFSATPDYVSYLCSIPNSPICLVDGGLVLISMVAITAMGRYLSKAMNRCDFLGRGLAVLEQHRLWDSDTKTYFRKRKRSVLNAEVPLAANKKLISSSANVIGGGSCLSLMTTPCVLGEVPADYAFITNAYSQIVDSSIGKVDIESSYVKTDEVPLCLDYYPNFSINNTGEVGAGDKAQSNKRINNEDSGSFSMLEVQKNSLRPRQIERGMSCSLDLCLGPPCSSTYQLSFDKISDRKSVMENKLVNISELCCEENGIWPYVQPLEDGNVICGVSFTDCTRTKAGHFVHSEGDRVTDHGEINFLNLRIPMDIPNLDGDGTSRKEENQMPHSLPEQPFIPKQSEKTCAKFYAKEKCSLFSEKVHIESAVNEEAFDPLKQQKRCNDADELISKVQKLKKRSNENAHSKEHAFESTIVSSKLEKTTLPQFESFIIEEEEGSGGYGTVYRARRKEDGKRIAIKCPHVNAHKHNVSNELKMLERFGGRNFVIKYEGAFKNGSSECFILEHVEHDRPEILKKEIDVVQLQWYGYCLFRALAYLHKQGVMHRDVKPGNFLFSRKQNKGYLIDFNLAMDLHQKYSIAGKSNSSHYTSSDHVPSLHSSSAIKDKRNVKGEFKQTSEHEKNLKKRACVGLMKNYPDVAGGNAMRSQGADGSGITSARTPSTENKREPLPCHGRKELISLVHNALLVDDHFTSNGSALKRKRIAAPLGKTDSKIVHPSPMLHCSGFPAASSRVKTKGDARRKRDGSCAGTKGFRAPEVLFRSLHQGPQVDVWSAGVTILYLMVGRSPFTGDPEQNIKDIARLRGSEDLWEVAKLHDRESAFPGELLHVRSFPAMDLQSWCKTHSRRPEFLKLIPKSLFDLVDKCLTVNPRRRISAEEALKHEFFNSCHESLRKQRLLRRGSGLNSGNVLGEVKMLEDNE